MTTKYLNPLACAVLGFSAFLAIRAPGLVNAMKDKALEQERHVTQLQQFRTNVDAIRPVRKIFDDTFTKAADIRDLVSLHRLIALEKLGLYIDKDSLMLMATPEAVSIDGPGGGDLALARICVTAGNGVLEARAPDMNLLLEGIAKLAARKDIEITSYTVSIEEKTKQAKVAFKDFCLLART